MCTGYIGRLLRARQWYSWLEAASSICRRSAPPAASWLGWEVYLACGSDAFGVIGGTTRSQDAMLTIFPPWQLSKVPHAGRGRNNTDSRVSRGQQGKRSRQVAIVAVRKILLVHKSVPSLSFGGAASPSIDSNSPLRKPTPCPLQPR